MVGSFDSTVCESVGSLKVLLWGQMVENRAEAVVTLASIPPSTTAEHIGQRAKDAWGSAGEVTGGVTATYLTMSSDREREPYKDPPASAEYVLLSRATAILRKSSTAPGRTALPFFARS